ncbi:MAG TPA: wax ester/triacylglycerol synthase family O-acyltransferase [Pseudomonadales bacterium]|nr:wax ester/triacylglycerol synthase family O-acyltransferase [Pseudomonadales bacterium]
MSTRLTAADASFLYTESASGPMHISSIYVLEGELAFAEVFDHFAERLHLIPAYRRRLALVPMNLAHPTWEDDPDFDLANHVMHCEVPPGSSLEDGIDAAIAINENMLDRKRPLWQAHVVTGVPGQTLILQMTHHALIDGASGIEITTIIYDLDPKGGNTPPAPTEPWRPARLPSALERAGSALRDNIQALRGNVQAAMDQGLPTLASLNGERSQMLGRAMRILQRFVTRPVVTAPFNAGMVGPKRRLRFMKKSFGEIREIRRALGGTINDVVLTVVSEAMARYLEVHHERTAEQYMRIMCPVNVRTESEEGALGNKVSAIFPVLPAWPMDVAKRLIAVCAETNRIKDDQEAQALALLTNSDTGIWPVAMAPTQLVGTPWDPTRLLARHPLPIMPNLGWRPPNMGINFVCTNVPGVQVPQYLRGHKVTDTIGVLVLSGNIGFSVTIMSYNKELFFCLICEPRLMPDLEVMLGAADSAFDELLAAARERMQQLSA